MNPFQFSTTWPDNFDGVVKLFPLPDLVLFPHVVQPLHIFEPRYCAMLEDSLKSDQLLGMALLQPNWQADYDRRPAIAQTVCIGKIVTHSPADNNRHNILLLGIKRARIVEELSTNKPYRVANVQVLQDKYPDEEAVHRHELADKLHNLFMNFVPEGLAAQESFQQMLGEQIPLGVLVDVITFATKLPTAIKLQLLAEENVDIRVRILIRCLQQKISSAKDQDSQPDSTCSTTDFPPPFSEN